MATLVVQQPRLRQSRSPPPPINSALALETSKLKSSAIPNKHIPYCSPGPAPSTQPRTPATPPASPPTKQIEIATPSILHPTNLYTKVQSEPPVYSIDAPTLDRALSHVSTNPLPEAKAVFPWLHGLHPDNQVQQAFFIARRKTLRRAPKCLRGITVVKVGGDLSKSKLKGAIAPAEVLAPTGAKDPMFFDVDPKEGFSVRNFHIQAAKMAMLSDIVIYKDDTTKVEDLRNTAQRFASAQKRYREKCATSGLELAEYNTFVVSSMQQAYQLLNGYVY